MTDSVLLVTDTEPEIGSVVFPSPTISGPPAEGIAIPNANPLDISDANSGSEAAVSKSVTMALDTVIPPAASMARGVF